MSRFYIELSILICASDSVKPDEELHGSNDSEEPESEEVTRPLKRK